jgi:hypothetical protein
MVTNTPSSPVGRRQLVLATTSKVLGTKAIPQAQLTAHVVEALAPLMAGPEVLQYLASELRSRETFATTSGGVVHVPALMDSIGWTISVDAHAAMADQLPIDQLAPIDRWTQGSGRVAVVEDRRVVGRVGRLTISTVCGCDEEPDDGWEDEWEVLRGPKGWLMPFVGDKVVLTTLGAELRVARLQRPTRPTQRQVKALKTGFARAHDCQNEAIKKMFAGAPPICSVSECLLEAVVVDRVAFLAAPVAPLDELFAAAGFRVREGFARPVAPAA